MNKKIFDFRECFLYFIVNKHFTKDFIFSLQRCKKDVSNSIIILLLYI